MLNLLKRSIVNVDFIIQATKSKFVHSKSQDMESLNVKFFKILIINQSISLLGTQYNLVKKLNQ